MNIKRNRFFFYPRNLNGPIVIFIFAAILFFLGRKVNFYFSVILSAVLVIVGIILAVSAIRNRVTESDIDAQFALGMEGLLGKAMAEFSLKEEDLDHDFPPMILSSYYVHEGGPLSLIQFGSDQKPRANNCESLALLFGKDEIYWYNYKYSLVFDEQKLDTHKFTYEQIADVWEKSLTAKCQDTRGRKLDIPCEAFYVQLKDDTKLTMCFINKVGEAKKVASAIDNAMVARGL